MWQGGAALAGVALVLLLGGCEELRRPIDTGAAVLPTEILPASGDPARGTVLAAASAFRDQGQGLASRPAEAAQAVAQLEYLAATIPAGGSWAAVSPGTGLALRGARDEVRAALGTAPEAAPGAVVQALAATHRALRAGDRSAAATALQPALFRPGGEETLDRLGRLGALPAAEQATAALAQEVARLDARSGWGGTALIEGAQEGATTRGLGLGY